MHEKLIVKENKLKMQKALTYKREPNPSALPLLPLIEVFAAPLAASSGWSGAALGP
mgnify:CR=1 FL=1